MLCYMFICGGGVFLPSGVYGMIMEICVYKYKIFRENASYLSRAVNKVYSQGRGQF
jgi:hypothetical protein